MNVKAGQHFLTTNHYNNRIFKIDEKSNGSTNLNSKIRFVKNLNFSSSFYVAVQWLMNINNVFLKEGEGESWGRKEKSCIPFRRLKVLLK